MPRPPDDALSGSSAALPLSLEALRVFARVAALGSFTRAAEQLGLPKARVSAAVQQLEEQLGTRLLHRTTRRVRLTPDGEQCLARAEGLLAEAEELQAQFRDGPSALQGRLRIDLSIHMARSVVLPRLPEFLEAHPLLQMELSATDRRVDLVRDGFDCVVRIGHLADSGLVARPLGQLRQINCASPAYLRRHGVPRTLDDLAQHRLVHYAGSLDAPSPGFEHVDAAGCTRFLPMQGAVTVNNTDAYQAACLAGLGLIQLPVFGVAGRLAEGALVEVLPEHVPAPLPITLLVAHRRHLAKRVQVLMDWLAEVITPALVAQAPSAAQAPRPVQDPGATRRGRRKG